MKYRWWQIIYVGCSFPELSTKNTRNSVLLCFSYGVAFSSISRMVAASATYMNTPLQLSQVSCHFQFLALFVFCATVHTVTSYSVQSLSVIAYSCIWCWFSWPFFTFMLPCTVIDFFLNNQPDALIIQIYSVIKLYIFLATSLPIIRSSLLYIRHW
jgi:hypothetical protein